MKFSMFASLAVLVGAVFACSPKPYGEVGVNYVYSDSQPASGGSAKTIVTYAGKDTILRTFKASDDVEWVSLDLDGDGTFDENQITSKTITAQLDAGMFPARIAIKKVGSNDVTVEKIDIFSLASTPYRKALIEDVSALWCGPCGQTFSNVANYLEPLTGLGKANASGLMMLWMEDRDLYGWQRFAFHQTRMDELYGFCYQGFIPYMTMNGSDTVYNAADGQPGDYCNFRGSVQFISSTQTDWIDLMNEINTISTDMYVHVRVAKLEPTDSPNAILDVEVSVTTEAATVDGLAERELRIYPVANLFKNTAAGATSTPSAAFGGKFGPSPISAPIVVNMNDFAVLGKTVAKHYQFDIPQDSTMHEWHPELNDGALLGATAMIVKNASHNFELVNAASDYLPEE